MADAKGIVQSGLNWPRRAATNYVTTAANATEQPFTITTIDDYRDRLVRTVYVGIATAGVTVRLYVQGQKYAEYDCTRFASGNEPVVLEVGVPSKLNIVVSLQNLAGAALTNVPIIIGYAPDPSNGP